MERIKHLYNPAIWAPLTVYCGLEDEMIGPFAQDPREATCSLCLKIFSGEIDPTDKEARLKEITRMLGEVAMGMFEEKYMECGSMEYGLNGKYEEV